MAKKSLIRQSGKIGYMKTLIVIPVKNVEKTILQVVDDINQHASKIKYLVIDYGSKDRTLELLDNNKIPYLSMPLSSKYKYALNVGMKYAKDQGYEAIIEYDGNNLYKAKYLKKLISKGQHYDLILGSRFLTSQYRNKKKFLCRVISWCIKLTTKKQVSDPTMRYRFYKIKVIEPLLHDKYWKSGPDAIAFLIASGYTFEEFSMELRYHAENKHYSQSTTLTRQRFSQSLQWIISIIFMQPFRKKV